MADERYAVRDYDSQFAGQSEVADSRTPLSVLLEGEPEEKAASAALVVEAAARIAERVADWMARAEGVELDEELLADLLRREIDGEIHEVRVITMRALLRYFWAGARTPWDALKALLAATRLISKPLLRGVSQAEVAWILGETKAATRAREKKRVEEFLERWGAHTVHFEGAQKSPEARETYARVQKGNRNRAAGKGNKTEKRR
jgi:hypothetical protein